MSLRKLFSNVPLMVRLQSTLSSRRFASKTVSDIIESAEEEPIFLEEESEDLERKRNKSRLIPAHRNILFGQKPYEESLTWCHDTVKYKKRILGRYGIEALGIPAGVAWPTPEEVKDAKEYERVAFPLTLQERWQKIKEDHRNKEEAIMARQEFIHAKMVKMKDMIAEVEQKVALKAAQLQEAKEKKERRLQEIRGKLASTGNLNADKVKEMLAKMEKEDKQKKKELKKQRMIEREKRRLATNMPIEGSEVDSEKQKSEPPESREGSPTKESTK